METVGLSPNVAMLNTFIEAYGRRGDIEKSKEEFQLVKDPTVFTYQSLMVGYCYHGDITGATGVFEEARSAGLGSNRRMASILLDTYLNSKDLDGAVSLLERFEDVRPEVPSCVHLVNECEINKRRDLTEKTLSFMTSLGLSQLDIDCVFTFGMMKSGQFDEAIDFLKSKQQYDTASISSAVVYHLHNLSDYNHVENIKLGIKLLDQLEIDSISLYTDLVKAYAARKDVEGILAVKKELEGSESKKPEPSFYTLVVNLLKKLKQSP